MLLKKITLGIMLCLLLTSSFSQDCNTSVTASTPDSRFTPQGDGTVLDTKTHLIWKRCLEGQTWSGATCIGSVKNYPWQGALEAAQTLNSSGGFASQTDWRVPNIKELSSIIELQCVHPAINLTVFPGAASEGIHVWGDYVWSSSPRGHGYAAWNVSFDDGGDYDLVDWYPQSKSWLLPVLLVRSGQ